MGCLTVLAVAAALLPLAGCLGDGKEPAAALPDEGLVCPAIDVENGTGPCGIDPPAADAAAVPAWPHFPSDGASEAVSLELPSFDEHLIPVTVFRPKVASPEQKVPVLLHSHGFTGSRYQDPEHENVKAWVAGGFGVVSFDERGHGESKDDSSVYFMHPEYEVKDVQRVIDHVATLDWVLMESPGDPLLGAVGGSYGGAYQLMTAIFDPRLDAIVPEITWNDITEALAPNGAVKSGWVDLFYVAGNAQQSVVFSDDFHAGFAYATAANQFPAGQLPGVPDLYKRLKEASPVLYPGRITIPTLLIQGMPDTLFPLNQAVANLRMLEAVLPANQTALYTHLGGHLLSVNSLRANTSPYPVGLQGQPGGKPCGELTDLQVAWHQKWLLGLPVDTGPRVCLSLEDETNVVGPAFPLPDTEMRRFELGGPFPIVQAPVGAQVPISLFVAEEDTIVAGLPHLQGTLTAPGADTIVYFSLKVIRPGSDYFEWIVDDQVVPLRVAGPNTSAVPFALDLGGVGVRLKAGEELLLVASTVEPMYFGNAERIPGGTVLDGLVLDLPIVPATAPSLPVPAA